MTLPLLLLWASYLVLAGIAVTRVRAWARRKREPFRARKIDAFLIAFWILLAVRLSIACPYLVTGRSMQPTLQPKELVLACPAAYWFAKPGRGDIVIASLDGEIVVKRITGEGGDLMQRTGTLYSIVAGPAIRQSVSARKLLADEIFLQGDNIYNSLDSRSLGPVGRNAVLGKVLVRVWPLTKAGPLD